MGPVEDIMQIWHVTNKGTRLYILEKFHTRREIKRDNQKKALFKAAERVWALVKFFFEPPSKDLQARGKVRKHLSAPYSGWPLAARSVNMTNHYLFTFFTIEKCGARYSVRPDRPWGTPSLLYDAYREFPGGKVRPERAADHSHTSSAAVMEE